MGHLNPEKRALFSLLKKVVVTTFDFQFGWETRVQYLVGPLLKPGLKIIEEKVLPCITYYVMFNKRVGVFYHNIMFYM